MALSASQYLHGRIEPPDAGKILQRGGLFLPSRLHGIDRLGPRKLIALRGPCERFQEVMQFLPSRLRTRCASSRRHTVIGRRVNWCRVTCSPKLCSLTHGAPPKVLPSGAFWHQGRRRQLPRNGGRDLAGEHGRIGHVHVAAARDCSVGGVGNGAPFAAMGQEDPGALDRNGPIDGTMRRANPPTPQGRPLCNFSVYPDSDGAAAAA